MKTNLYTKIFLILFISTFSSLSLFSSTHIKEVFANNNFQISENNDILNIDINKRPWESFTFAIDNMEILNNPIVNLDFFSNEDITLRVDLTDGVSMSSETDIKTKSIRSTSAFQTVTFDFTNAIDKLDVSGEIYLVFYVNPGKDYQGKITIKNFNLQSETPDQNTNPTALTQSFHMFPSPATTFTNIEIPEKDIQTLNIIDMRGRVVATFDVSFYNGSTYHLELGDFPKGYYSVQLTMQNTTLTQKLIIN